MQRAILRLNRYSPKNKMVKKAVLFLTEKAEDTEVVITVDTLRRSGFEVIIAGVNGVEPVTCVQYTRIVPDVEIERLQNEVFDVVIVPGGPGSDSLNSVPLVQEIVKNHFEQDKLIAAICAGTKVLNKLKIGYGRKMTTYPKYVEEIEKNYQYTGARVECDGNLITSQGPGTAFEFGLEIVKHFFGNKKAMELAEMLRVNNFKAVEE